ncbi:MAG: hypothetical protein WCK02_12605 [Bacteroidota bacterium]
MKLLLLIFLMISITAKGQGFFSFELEYENSIINDSINYRIIKNFQENKIIGFQNQFQHPVYFNSFNKLFQTNNYPIDLMSFKAEFKFDLVKRKFVLLGIYPCFKNDKSKIYNLGFKTKDLYGLISKEQKVSLTNNILTEFFEKHYSNNYRLFNDSVVITNSLYSIDSLEFMKQFYSFKSLEKELEWSVFLYSDSTLTNKISTSILNNMKVKNHQSFSFKNGDSIVSSYSLSKLEKLIICEKWEKNLKNDTVLCLNRISIGFVFDNRNKFWISYQEFKEFLNIYYKNCSVSEIYEAYFDSLFYKRNNINLIDN